MRRNASLGRRRSAELAPGKADALGALDASFFQIFETPNRIFNALATIFVIAR
jgi:hypothetical protein